MAVIKGTNGNNNLQGFSGQHFAIDPVTGLLILYPNGNDTICGFGGNDTIDGKGGNDTIDGGNGNDTIDGGSGNDTISGGFDVDVLNGGAGVDTVSYTYASGGFNIDLAAEETFLFSRPENIEVIESFENVLGSQGNDSIYGDNGANKLEGRNGNDRIYGRNGNDTLCNFHHKIGKKDNLYLTKGLVAPLFHH